MPIGALTGPVDPAVCALNSGPRRVDVATMFRKRGRADDLQPTNGDRPSDVELAQQMCRFAEIFREGSAAEGHHLDFEGANVDRLDALADLFLRGDPSLDLVRSMTVSMGAYLGELIVRQGAGRWVFEPRSGEPGIRLSGSTLTCFPLNKVGKRLTVGPEHNFRQFYDTAVTGTLPPEARRVAGPV